MAEFGRRGPSAGSHAANSRALVKDETGAGPWNRGLYRLVRFLLGDLVLRPYFRLSVRGLEHLPKSGAVILAPNHCSLLDPLVLQSALPRRIVFLMTLAWYRRRLLRPFFVLMRAIAVRDDGGNRGAMSAAAAALEHGAALGIFPEGRISADGTLRGFQAGAAVLAIRQRVPVVPVRIVGTFAALKKGARIPRPARVSIVLGPALVAPECVDEPTQRRACAAEFTQRIRAAVEALPST
ncbi:MAG: 1-acyl-sn-glycerol-3-phosphate acyltransferase [Planctomycetes bacterium]|nr:1-acyl-sn-glycerol-3-phosphate acyltransferase [Planctomycetota bacterium]MCC7171707.1 1-acyl-sn-glycerol-3-phosphate acyltransferase [Planctomycetota bacterium]